MESFGTIAVHDPKALYHETLGEEKSVRVIPPLYYDKARLRCQEAPQESGMYPV